MTQHAGLELKPHTWVLTELKAFPTWSFRDTRPMPYKTFEKDLHLLHWPRCSQWSLLFSFLLAVHTWMMGWIRSPEEDWGPIV